MINAWKRTANAAKYRGIDKPLAKPPSQPPYVIYQLS